MQSSMRSVLSFLDAPQLNAPEAYVQHKADAFGDDGEVRDEGTAKFLRHYMEEYGAFVARVLAANAPGHIGDLEPDADKLSRCRGHTPRLADARRPSTAGIRVFAAPVRVPPRRQSSGSVTVTEVPWPGWESMSTEPPASWTATAMSRSP